MLESDHPRRNVGADIRWGLRIGAGIATACSVVALVSWTLVVLGGGGSEWMHGTSIITVLAVYAATGGLGGVLVGVLRPWTRSGGGIVAVTLLATALMYTVFSITDQGRRPLSMTDNIGGLVMSLLVVGLPAGLITRSQVLNARRKTNRRGRDERT